MWLVARALQLIASRLEIAALLAVAHERPRIETELRQSVPIERPSAGNDPSAQAKVPCIEGAQMRLLLLELNGPLEVLLEERGPRRRRRFRIARLKPSGFTLCLDELVLEGVHARSELIELEQGDDSLRESLLRLGRERLPLGAMRAQEGSLLPQRRQTGPVTLRIEKPFEGIARLVPGTVDLACSHDSKALVEGGWREREPGSRLVFSADGRTQVDVPVLGEANSLDEQLGRHEQRGLARSSRAHLAAVGRFICSRCASEEQEPCCRDHCGVTPIAHPTHSTCLHLFGSVRLFVMFFQ